MCGFLFVGNAMTLVRLKNRFLLSVYELDVGDQWTIMNFVVVVSVYIMQLSINTAVVAIRRIINVTRSLETGRHRAYSKDFYTQCARHGCVLYTHPWRYNTHPWRARERELIMGGWGGAPSGVPWGRAPGGGQGQSFPEADEVFVFKTLIFNASAIVLHKMTYCLSCFFALTFMDSQS